MKEIIDRSPILNATVTRQKNGALLIGWENDEKVRSVSIFAGPSPENI